LAACFSSDSNMIFTRPLYLYLYRRPRHADATALDAFWTRLVLPQTLVQNHTAIDICISSKPILVLVQQYTYTTIHILVLVLVQVLTVGDLDVADLLRLDGGLGL